MTPTPAILGGQPAFPDGLPLVRPTLPDVPDLARRLGMVLATGVLTNGPTVRELEQVAADQLGVRHVVAVSSCTSGLLLALQAAGVRGGRVVLPSFTFSATAHVVHYAGAQPRFADVEASTLTLDPVDVAERIAGASAIVATHLYGTPCDVEALQRLADSAGIPLVYDAAHALGSLRGTLRVGGFGSAEVFSLSPTKVVVAGEGGLVATNDEALAEYVRIGRDYGNPGDYDCLFPGINARMSELHATVALASLEGLDARIAHRNALVHAFKEALAGVAGVDYPVVRQQDRSTYKDLTLVVDPDAFGLSVPQLQAALRAEGIDTRRYYFPPVHRQKAYVGLGDLPLLPVTDRVAERVVSPPLWSHMQVADMVAVASAIARIHRHAVSIRDMVGTGGPR